MHESGSFLFGYNSSKRMTTWKLVAEATLMTSGFQQQEARSGKLERERVDSNGWSKLDCKLTKSRRLSMTTLAEAITQYGWQRTRIQ
jgi:hypothetical protein